MNILENINPHEYTKFPNVTGFMFGLKTVNHCLTDELSLVFFVKEKKNIDDLKPHEIIPSSVSLNGANYKTDVYEATFEFMIEITTDPQYCPPPWNQYQNSYPPNTNLINPIQGGVQIGPTNKGSWGTLGTICVDNDTNSLVGLTNSHVAVLDGINTVNKCPNWGWIFPQTNEIIKQPFRGWYPPYVPQNTLGLLKKFVQFNYPPLKNYVDAALFSIDDSVFDSNESWKQYGLTGLTTPPPFATTQEIDNLIYTRPNLFSSGARTGPKGEGEVKLVLYGTFGGLFIYSNSIPYGAGLLEVFFENVLFYVASGATTPIGFVCANPIDGGDSGSCVLAEINGVKKIVGLAFAGYNSGTSRIIGVFCRIDKVAELLNLSAYTGQTVNFSDINNVQYYHSSTLDGETSLSLSGNTYWQMGVNILSPTPTGSNTPTPTITSSITPTPTITNSITPTPTITSSITPTPTPTSSITPTPTPTNTLPLVTDYDGNTYEQIIIGNRVWLGGNMKTTHYNNGDIIPYRGYLSGNTEPFCSFSGEGAWMYTKLSDNFPEDPNYNQTAGKLYNYYTITDVRGICPVGFRPADTGDWYNLSISLGGGISGGQSPSNFYPINGGLNGALAPYTGFSQQIKSTLNPPYGWTILASEPIPTNSSNFSAYPSGGIYAGIEDTCNPFFNGNNECWWWTNSSNFYLPDTINYVYLGGTVLGGDSAQPNSALCIRCVRDLV